METTLEKPEGETPFAGLLRAIQERIESQVVSHEYQARTKITGPGIITTRLDKITDMTPLQAHDIVTSGLPVVLAREMMDQYKFVAREAVLQAIGVSERTLQRGKGGERLLDSNASDRLLRLAAITEQAIDALGSKEAAEQWLMTPALGLDQRRPIDLLQSSEGTELVKTLLTRMDYGVYA